MVDIKKDFSIKNFNTFCVDVKAKFFAEVNSLDELRWVLNEMKDEKLFILGGGSNTLFVNDWDGLVLQINIKGLSVKKEDKENVYVECFAGEVWDDFVKWCVEKNYAGVENMVNIPGSVGGGISQNIGAYGQEIKDVVSEVLVFDVEKKLEETLKAEACGFEYRFSNFKDKWKERYVIVKGVFKLRKESDNLELSYKERAGRYGSLLEELQSFAKEPYSLKDVMEAVQRQREKRLPSVDDWGTCGSFFKNPVVRLKKFEELSKKISDLQSYPTEDPEFVKIPAGRLLDALDWKGKWNCNVGVFEKHALCVVTNKKAKGKDVLDFIEKMKKSVKDKYGVELKEEVNIVF